MNNQKMKRRLVNAGFKVTSATPDWVYSYDYDDYKKFLEEYPETTDDIVIDEREEGKFFTLTPEAAKELQRTYKVFTSREQAEKRFEGVKEWVEKTISEILVEELGIDPKDLEVEAKYDEELGAKFYRVYPKYKGKSLPKIELDSLYYRGDEGAEMSEAAKSWPWAAWLGIDDSPFYSSEWYDDYIFDHASQWFEEAPTEDGISYEMKSYIDTVKDQILE